MENLTKKKLDELTYEVVGAAIEVHRIMGRGLLESVYHECMKEELNIRKINFLTEMKIPVLYKEKELKVDFRYDLFVGNCLVVELKAVIEMHPMFEAKLLNHMKLLKAPKGILINFNCVIFSMKGKQPMSTNFSNYCNPKSGYFSHRMINTWIFLYTKNLLCEV